MNRSITYTILFFFLAILFSIIACGKDSGLNIDNDTDNNNDNPDTPLDIGFGAFEDDLNTLTDEH